MAAGLPHLDPCQQARLVLLVVWIVPVDVDVVRPIQWASAAGRIDEAVLGETLGLEEDIPSLEVEHRMAYLEIPGLGGSRHMG